MREEIVFTWSQQEQAKTWRDPWLDKPAWAQVAGFGCVALSSTAPPETGQNWVSLTETPRVGELLNLRVWQPFHGALRDLIWVAYSPPAVHGPAETTWCDDRPSLPTGGLALCLITAVLSHDEPERYYLPGAWLQVSIEEVTAVPDLASRFAPSSAGRPFPPGIEPDSRRLWGCQWGDLSFLELSAEGDLQEWLVWQRQADGARVVMGGERIFDDDIMYAGHRPLSATELRYLEACQRAAKEYPDPR